MEHFATLKIDKEELDYYEHTMKTAMFNAGDGNLVTMWTVEFDDGHFADLKIVDCSRREGGPWSEVVLFDSNGCEVDCTEVDDSLRGEWWVRDGENENYTVVVEEA